MKTVVMVMTTLTKKINAASSELLEKYKKITWNMFTKINNHFKNNDVSDTDKLEIHSLTLMCDEFEKFLKNEYRAFKGDGRTGTAKMKDWKRLKKLMKAGYNVVLDEIIRLKKLGIVL